MPTSKAANTPHKPVKETVKETIISVIIAFALAFVFRAFVAEAYVIPTGSMAPTLNGAHVRMNSPTTGADWAVGPTRQFFVTSDGQVVQPEWGTAMRNLTSSSPVPAEGFIAHDPLTGDRVASPRGISRTGDRIFVHKYLYALAQPEPWDVIVFKDPTNPDQNFIKRLIGLPNEEIALVDGDVFVRKLPRPAAEGFTWQQDGWQIRRKPLRVQRAVWQRVYDSNFAPASPAAGASPSPWVGDTTKLTPVDQGRAFAFDGSSATLQWNTAAKFLREPPRSQFDTRAWQVDGTRDITDRYWYNESSFGEGRTRFLVGDVRIRFGLRLEPGANPASLVLAPTVTSDGHDFRALVQNQRVKLQMRPSADAASTTPEWKDLLASDLPMPAIQPGVTTDIEFCHVDQSLAFFVAGEQVAYAAYDWSPSARLAFATRPDIFSAFKASDTLNIIESERFKPVGVRIDLAGAKLSLQRVGLDRDLYYTPATEPPYERLPNGTFLQKPSRPARATSPLAPLALGPDQFFACGDNSPNSSDGRLWTNIDPWVAHEMDPTMGIVDRRLLLGKAFFVYWPALGGNGRVPVPDVGRMRFIQ